MRQKSYLVTSEGLANIKAELSAKLKKKEALAEVLNKSRSEGDLSENDGYALAMDDFKNIDSEVSRLQDLINNSKIVKGKVSGKVEIGDEVIIVDIKGIEKRFTLVGENEGDPLAAKVSHNSPLGKAILGKKTGENFEFKTPRETVKYTVKKVLD